MSNSSALITIIRRLGLSTATIIPLICALPAAAQAEAMEFSAFAQLSVPSVGAVPYTVATVSVPANTWTTVLAPGPVTTLVVGDTTGGACAWTARLSGQVTGEGVPFSLNGSPGSNDFGPHPPTTGVSVRCASPVTITVQAG